MIWIEIYSKTLMKQYTEEFMTEVFVILQKNSMFSEYVTQPGNFSFFHTSLETVLQKKSNNNLEHCGKKYSEESFLSMMNESRIERNPCFNLINYGIPTKKWLLWCMICDSLMFGFADAWWRLKWGRIYVEIWKLYMVHLFEALPGMRISWDRFCF